MADSMLVPGLVPGLVLGIDTCGPAGSVALGRLAAAGSAGPEIEILGQKELAGRTYAATLVAAVGELLTEHNANMKSLHAVVAVRGPGSFTGVRVGLSAVKGLAEPGGVPVATVSRLAVLAAKAGTIAAALDAHRNEVFLRTGESENAAKEHLAGADDLKRTEHPTRIAICDDAAAAMMRAAWQDAELVRVEPPSAADALILAAPMVRRGESADLALLDGHYLRRSDAEIFGDPAGTGARRP